MERFVFIVAITVALAAGAFYFLGGPSFSINIDGIEHDGGRQDAIVEVAPGQMAAQTFTAGEIRVIYAAANVTVTPEDRQDIVVEIDNSAGRAPMPDVRVDDGDLLIDGRLRRRIDNCSSDGVDLRGYGAVSTAQMPQVRIRAPRRLVIDVNAGSNAEIGAAEAVDLDFSSCGRATVGDVSDRLDVDVAGSGTIRTGSALRAELDLAGSGDIETGAIGESANVDIAGSGRVTLGAVNGSLSLDGAGSGNFIVRGGEITDASVDLAGSGGADITANVQSLNVSIVGSGDVDVVGTVGDIDADIAGSGGVRASAVTGAVRKEVWGSGDVVVGR